MNFLNDYLLLLLPIVLSICGFVLGFLISGSKTTERVVTKTVVIDKQYGAQKKAVVGTIKRPSVEDYERRKNPKLAETEDAMSKTFEELGI